MKVTQSVFLAALISLPPTLCQAQGQTPAPAPAAQPAVAVPQPQPTAVAGNGPLAKALVEFTICFQTAVDRVAAIIALENGMGRGAVGSHPTYRWAAGMEIRSPYTSTISAYEAGYAKGTGWANPMMVRQGLVGVTQVADLGVVALIPALAGQGAAMVIGEQNLCVKRLNDQLKY